jgi:hypothetical protein
MFTLLFRDYTTTYRVTRDTSLKTTNDIKLGTGPYKDVRDTSLSPTLTPL